MIKKISWILKRHPYLYYVRFKLLSKKVHPSQVYNYSYNAINKKCDIPEYFKTINDDIFRNGNLSNDVDKVIKMASWLRTHIKGGSGLSLSSEKALRIMLTGSGGVCSDLSQIFNNFCVINDIQVKEWGITNAPYDGSFGGHAFNEFYSKELKKWLLIDVSKSIMFYLKGNERPLSVLETFEYRHQPGVVFKSFLASNTIEEGLIENYYLEQTRVPFLICNYSNKTYDIYLDRFQSIFPIFMIHFWLYILNKSYYYLFPLSDHKVLVMNER